MQTQKGGKLFAKSGIFHIQMPWSKRGLTDLPLIDSSECKQNTSSGYEHHYVIFGMVGTDFVAGLDEILRDFLLPYLKFAQEFFYIIKQLLRNQESQDSMTRCGSHKQENAPLAKN